MTTNLQEKREELLVFLKNAPNSTEYVDFGGDKNVEFTMSGMQLSYEIGNDSPYAEFLGELVDYDRSKASEFQISGSEWLALFDFVKEEIRELGFELEEIGGGDEDFVLAHLKCYIPKFNAERFEKAAGIWYNYNKQQRNEFM